MRILKKTLAYLIVMIVVTQCCMPVAETFADANEIVSQESKPGLTADEAQTAAKEETDSKDETKKEKESQDLVEKENSSEDASDISDKANDKTNDEINDKSSDTTEEDALKKEPGQSVPDAQEKTEEDYGSSNTEAGQESEQQTTSEEEDKESKEEDPPVEEASPIELRSEGKDYTVTVTDTSGSRLPADAGLKVKEVEKKVEKKDCLDEANEMLRGSKKIIREARFFDITILTPEGEEIQPDDTVKVDIRFNDEKEPVLHDDDTQVIHFEEDHKTGEKSVVGIDQVDMDAEQTVSFQADSFSIYGVCYTVDFQYGEYTYSIEGGSSITLSELFKKLEIDEDASGVLNVTFSDESLVKVEKKDGEWTLTSLRAFQSDEKLTVEMPDKVIEILVTDAPTGSYITFSSNSSFSIRIANKGWDGTLQYNTSQSDSGWTDYTAGNTITSVVSRGKYYIYFRGSGNTKITGNSSNSCKWTLTATDDVDCDGNIMSLLDHTSPPISISKYYCFAYMFYQWNHLASAPELPATTLKDDCYDSMFFGCTGLTSAPALPATTLASSCYANMFSDCTSLTNAPSLPVTTLASSCYAYMFKNCTSLTSAPALPATTLVSSCYWSMFENCTGLTSAPALPATTLNDSCYRRMFYGCTGLTEAPELPATSLSSRCYYEMFKYCVNLVSAPELPATTLADYCYCRMFADCRSMDRAPEELPAMTLANNCYDSMFYSCIDLTNAPELPAMTLARECYCQMFWCCKSLTCAPELPATTLADRCYYSMFSSCYGLRIPPELPATTLADYCYNAMFSGCLNMRLSETQQTVDGITYNKPYRIPKDGTGTTASNALSYMFNDTGGPFIGTPEINTTYYLPATGVLTFDANGGTVSPTSKEVTINDIYGVLPLPQRSDDFYFIGWFTEPSGGTQVSFNTKMRNSNETIYAHWKHRLYSASFSNDGKYLCFTSSAPFSINVNIPGWNGILEYSTGLDWVTWDGSSISAEQNGGTGKYYLYVRGNENTRITGSTGLSDQDYGRWTLTATDGVECDGNIMSLLDYDAPPTVISMGYCFSYMFYKWEHLTSAPELPATALADYCYYYMFRGCTGLTSAPELPATTLAKYCYGYMFYGCTGLTSAPELPAMTLDYCCYNSMFSGCTSLTSAPALPATTLDQFCYSSMLFGCTSLTSVPELPATTLARSCYNYMFYGCTNIRLSETKQTVGEISYGKPYRIPKEGTGTTATYALNGMFSNTGGPFTGTPEINRTYYLPATDHVLSISHTTTGGFADANRNFTYTLTSIDGESSGGTTCEYTLRRGGNETSGSISTGDTFTINSNDVMEIEAPANSEIVITAGTGGLPVSWMATGESVTSGNTASATVTLTEDTSLAFSITITEVAPTGMHMKSHMVLILLIIIVLGICGVTFLPLKKFKISDFKKK